MYFLQSDIALVQGEMASQTDIALLQCDMKKPALRLKHDLTLRLGGMLAASVPLVAALVKML
ncbi:hypothetical protein [Desulfobacca acetoxidans]|uniref:Uncharacterized protein n=1 Tax=Desulfobacca acetoxidans (strain ATCC 700848 / DSM 11109 / ASRB2) TaxID=880072 RepID=F2NCM1_DESAR|nr:hypothetical protein [Desulfobacca acetoxidans]AEB09155.1 hypothetical protein Desac_1298 [Desulfobacca acetoxidans DSM 11109]